MSPDDEPQFDSAASLWEPRSIDEARHQMVADLHRAVFGDTPWARPDPPSVVWAELLDRIARARRQFQR